MTLFEQAKALYERAAKERVGIFIIAQSGDGYYHAMTVNEVSSGPTGDEMLKDFVLFEILGAQDENPNPCVQ